MIQLPCSVKETSGVYYVSQFLILKTEQEKTAPTKHYPGLSANSNQDKNINAKEQNKANSMIRAGKAAESQNRFMLPVGTWQNI